ncbi:cytochrome P450 [Trametes punicea]|nr:cytochrome P450 [Trametes punicea]
MILSSQVLVPLILFCFFNAIDRFLKFRQAVRAVNNWPGYRTLLSASFLYFPFQVPGISPGQLWPFQTKHRYFARAGWDVLAAVNLLPSAEVMFYIADPAVVKEVVGARTRFPKITKLYHSVKTFGSNIMVTEGEEWKRHRKIAAPAFSERNYRLVWDETIRIVDDLIQNVWNDKEVVELPNILDVTVGITLRIIGVAGFGRRILWVEDNVVPPGYSMSFKDALFYVSHYIIFKVVFPDWLIRWGTPTMRRFALAFDELNKYLREMVQDRRTAKVREERHDLLSNLLDANEGELDTAAKLTESEVIGNIFIFLVAGYETTAHTLAYAFILLALYPDEQEKFYQSLKATLPSDQSPTYAEFNSLSYAMAVLNETLRHFPPVMVVPKECAEDTAFTLTNTAGKTATIPVPAGSGIGICVPSMHFNPRYWDDPEAFKPERFLGNYPRDAFLPFSAGARGCIGRRFAETESVAVLSMIISRYKVEVQEEPQFAGETFEQRKARLLKSQNSLTIYPERAPLVFKRR